MFILACVTAACIYGAPTDVKLNKWFFCRDALFLLVALLMLCYSVQWRQVIDLPMAVAFSAAYGVYVIVVILQDIWFKKNATVEEFDSWQA